jgi:hypothetical protein
VPVIRPRMRAVDCSSELPVPAYELFCSTELLLAIALERMQAVVSTRSYRVLVVLLDGADDNDSPGWIGARSGWARRCLSERCEPVR